MEIADNPIKVPLPFANSAGGAYKNSIPTASQIGVQNGRASFTDGFPPLNFVPIASGGVPPFGGDFNGLLYQITAGLRWLQAGGPVPYDLTFVTATGGYPEGAIIASAVTPGLLWVSTVDNNTSDPDAGGANWLMASIANARVRLGAAITFYVATTGSDANDGLSPATPFLTIQRAATLVQNAYDLNGFVATISIATGTYAAGAQINGAVPGATSPASIVFTASGAVTITGSGYCFAANQGSMFTIASNNFTLAASLSGGLGSAVVSTGGSRISVAGIVTYGSSALSHVLATTGGQVVYTATETVAGNGAQAHFHAHAGGVITANSVGAVITGTPNFSVGYAVVDEGGIVEAAAYTVISGGTTGPRFSAISNGVINVNGGGIHVFPGSVEGTPSTGGQYV